MCFFFKPHLSEPLEEGDIILRMTAAYGWGWRGHHCPSLTGPIITKTSQEVLCDHTLSSVPVHLMAFLLLVDFVIGGFVLFCFVICFVFYYLSK